MGLLQHPVIDRPTRVVVADDEGLFRASLRQLLSVPPAVLQGVYGIEVGFGFEVVAEAGTGAETVQVVAAASPDLLLLDSMMPRLNGLDALLELGAARETFRVGTFRLVASIRFKFEHDSCRLPQPFSSSAGAGSWMTRACHRRSSPSGDVSVGRRRSEFHE